MLTDPGLESHFVRLGTVLLVHDTYWRPSPFCETALPWQRTEPGLYQDLLALPDDEAAQLETNPTALAAWLGERVPALAGLGELATVNALPATITGYPSRFDHDIPGRKWQQVTAFTACLPPLQGPVLEWCAGKAHLGRAIHHRFKQPVTGLERNTALCRDGNALSQHHDCGVTLHACDVMHEAALAYLQQAGHAVALHACGDLHRRLIERVADLGSQSLHLSPCCYHLTPAIAYRPLSRAGQECGLSLTREDLRLAVQETVTAPGSVARLRQRKSAYRLGFDLLQRQLRQTDAYLPVPSIAERDFSQGFTHFARQAAALKQLPLPEGIDWAHWEALGWQRHAEVTRLELLRHGFRRVLELWLVLDYALFLQDAGYRVRVGTFCNRELTPRNLLISATRASHNLSQ